MAGRPKPGIGPSKGSHRQAHRARTLGGVCSVRVVCPERPGAGIAARGAAVWSSDLSHLLRLAAVVPTIWPVGSNPRTTGNALCRHGSGHRPFLHWRRFLIAPVRREHTPGELTEEEIGLAPCLRVGCDCRATDPQLSTVLVRFIHLTDKALQLTQVSPEC